MSLASPYIAPVYIHSSVKRRKNTWYSVKDGNWTDPTVWMSNASKRWSYPGQNIPSPVFPQVGDDVYVNHSIACNITTIVNNLFVSGSLTSASSVTLTVNGDIQAMGTVSFSSSFTLVLKGVNNFINTFSSGTSSTVNYSRFGDQPVMLLPYRNLTIGASGTKTLTGDTTLTGNLILSTVTPIAILELSTFNLTVNGTTNHGNGTILRTPVSTGALLLLIGKLSSNQSNATINVGSTNDIEMRGGYDWDVHFITARTMTLSLSQTWATTSTSLRVVTVTADILVKTGVTITQNYGGATVGNSWIYHTGTLLAESSTSIWNLTTGSFNFMSSTAWDNKMSGGQFNVSSTAGLGFTWAGDFTIPFTSLGALLVSSTAATGNKYLSGNTIISGFITFASTSGSGAVLECSIYDLTVSAATSATMSKTGAGNLLFIGNATGVCAFTGNPTIEMRGGCGLSVNTGSGQVSFTTNNQSVVSLNSWANPIIISGAITLTLSSSQTFIGTVNGNNAASTIDNRATVNYQNSQAPMLIGILQTNAAANTFIYNKAGDQDVKGGAYRTLQLAGSGNKTLQGNVTTTSYTLTAPAVLVLNGFTRA